MLIPVISWQSCIAIQEHPLVVGLRDTLGRAKVSHAQLCLTLCSLMCCSLPGSSVHGIFQARILKWVAISSSGIIFLTQGLEPPTLALAGRFLTSRVTSCTVIRCICLMPVRPNKPKSQSLEQRKVSCRAKQGRMSSMCLKKFPKGLQGLSFIGRIWDESCKVFDFLQTSWLVVR